MDELLEFHRGFTESAASNPGRLAVHWGQYSQCFPLWPIICFMGTPVAIALSIAVHWAFWILAAIVLLLDFAWWMRTRLHFVGGCINPGKVVSLDPPLIAVFTDLTKGEGYEHPVVKVLKHPLSRMSGGPFGVGQRIATIATYEHSDEDKPHWSDTYPVAVHCATTDLDEIDRVTAALDKDSWRKLDQALEQVPEPYEPGLYQIKLRRRK
jgi:hypothetical protein